MNLLDYRNALLSTADVYRIETQAIYKKAIQDGLDDLLYETNTKGINIDEGGRKERYSSRKMNTFVFYGSELNSSGRSYIEANPIGTWAGFRSAQGLPSSKVTLEYTGKLKESAFVRVLAFRNGQINVTVGYNDDKTKIQELLARYGTLGFFATKDINAILRDTDTEVMRKISTKF